MDLSKVTGIIFFLGLVGFSYVDAKVEAKNLSTTGTNNGPFFDINGYRPSLPGAGDGDYKGAANSSLVGLGDGTCLQSAQYANGLFTGQYMAPVGEYIFPENTLAGFPVLPNSFWHMGFLIYGENGRDGNALGPQAPTPW